jgi:hypothetical protein
MRLEIAIANLRNDIAYLKEEASKTHEFLTSAGVPLKNFNGEPYSLEERVKKLERKYILDAKEIEDYYLNLLPNNSIYKD